MSNVVDVSRVMELSGQLDSIKDLLDSINDKLTLDSTDIKDILFVLENDKRGIFNQFYKARKGLVARGQIHPDVLVVKAALSLQRVLTASQMIEAMDGEYNIKVTEGNVDDLSRTVEVTVKDKFLQPDELAYFNNSVAYAYTTDPVMSLVSRFRESFIGFSGADENVPEMEKVRIVGRAAQAIINNSAMHYNV